MGVAVCVCLYSLRAVIVFVIENVTEVKLNQD